MTRIPTSNFYSRSLTQMTSLNGEADRLQTQISTGKKLTAASQDAGGWSRLATLKRGAADDKAAAGNIDLAAGILSQADTALDGMTQQLQRAQEIAIQAGNGTLTADQRAAFATQVDAIMADVLALANQRDVRGVPMFGGGADGAFQQGAGGAVSYVGGTTPGTIPTGEGTSVQVTEDGTRLAQMFTALTALSDAIRDGTGIGAASDDLSTAVDTVTALRGGVGARGMRLDIEAARLKEVAVDRKEAQSAIEDTDLSAAITELQKTLTILSATQASFTKLSNLSLFDQIR
jgi:flagellar hook-associated protein 3 FlgL